ncbi:MAG: tRNA dihydrouridine(20/20a) synthase DusA [Exilibacterium sp.]
MQEKPLQSANNPTTTRPRPDRRFCVAPMMDWSDRHCRYLWRLISRHALLYTEMVTTAALIHGDRERFLRYRACEHPLALQLGGSDPNALAQCARMAQEWGYDEVNLNCGCPSDRVQSGKIGACLMAEPALVADAVKGMREAVSIPVTIKHRIGIDDMDDFSGLVNFVGTVAEAGCETFIVHARKAWLKGLSPKENREVPPLQYELVYRLKQEFPHLEIILNGGITTLEQCHRHLRHVDGVMVGREAYSNPYLLSQVDVQFYSDPRPAPSREQVLRSFAAYCGTECQRGTRLNHMSRHVLGLFQGVPGARRFRRHISEFAHRPDADIDILFEAMSVTSQ